MISKAAPDVMPFSQVEIGEYFTPGWGLQKKLSDRTALIMVGEDAGDIDNFRPTDTVENWHGHFPTQEERWYQFTHNAADLFFTLIRAYSVNLTKYKQGKKIDTLEGQRVRGNFFIPGEADG